DHIAKDCNNAAFCIVCKEAHPTRACPKKPRKITTNPIVESSHPKVAPAAGTNLRSYASVLANVPAKHNTSIQTVEMVSVGVQCEPLVESEETKCSVGVQCGEEISKKKEETKNEDSPVEKLV